MLGLPDSAEPYTFYRGEGCPECFNTGYRGRIGAFEILSVTPEMRRAIHAGSLQDMEQAIKKAEFQPIMSNCRDLVLRGVTSAAEVHRVLGSEL